MAIATPLSAIDSAGAGCGGGALLLDTAEKLAHGGPLGTCWPKKSAWGSDFRGGVSHSFLPSSAYVRVSYVYRLIGPAPSRAGPPSAPG